MKPRSRMSSEKTCLSASMLLSEILTLCGKRSVASWMPRKRVKAAKTWKVKPQRQGSEQQRYSKFVLPSPTAFHYSTGYSIHSTSGRRLRRAARKELLPQPMFPSTEKTAEGVGRSESMLGDAWLILVIFFIRKVYKIAYIQPDKQEITPKIFAISPPFIPYAYVQYHTLIPDPALFFQKCIVPALSQMRAQEYNRLYHMYMPIPTSTTGASSIFESILEEYSSPSEEEPHQANDPYHISATLTKQNDGDFLEPADLWLALDQELQLCLINAGEQRQEGVAQELRRLQQLREEQEGKLRELTRTSQPQPIKKNSEDYSETATHYRPSKSVSPKKTKRIDKSKPFRLTSFDF